MCHTLLTSLSFFILFVDFSIRQVQAEIKRKWRRWMLQRFLSADTKYQQPSIGSNGHNNSTQITLMAKSSPAMRRASKCQEHLSTIWDAHARSKTAFYVSIILYQVCCSHALFHCSVKRVTGGLNWLFNSYHSRDVISFILRRVAKQLQPPWNQFEVELKHTAPQRIYFAGRSLTRTEFDLTDWSDIYLKASGT